MMSLCALLAEFINTACFPQRGFIGNWVISLYFLFLYVGASMFVHQGMSSAEFTRFFIGFKAAKMFFSLLFVAISAFLMRDNVQPFLFNFFAYYLLLLIPECAYCIYMKKHIR